MEQNAFENPEKKVSKNFFSKKKLFFLISFIAVVVVAIWYGKNSAKGVVKVGSLSDRGKEFLSQQAQQGDTIWNQVDFSESSPSTTASNNTKQVTPCFTVYVPFEVTKVQNLENDQGFLCRLEMQVQSPRSNLVITAKVFNSVGGEDPGITLRKNNPNDFQKIELPLKTKKQYQAFLSEDSLSVFFQDESLTITVAFSQVLQLDLLDLDRVAELIDSIVITDKNP